MAVQANESLDVLRGCWVAGLSPDLVVVTSSLWPYEFELEGAVSVSERLKSA
jgi:hypothetical protein